MNLGGHPFEAAGIEIEDHDHVFDFDNPLDPDHHNDDF
jgi:hypothetical protein